MIVISAVNYKNNPTYLMDEWTQMAGKRGWLVHADPGERGWMGTVVMISAVVKRKG